MDDIGPFCGTTENPVIAFLKTSVLGFKARSIPSLVCFVECVRRIMENFMENQLNSYHNYRLEKVKA